MCYFLCVRFAFILLFLDYWIPVLETGRLVTDFQAVIVSTQFSHQECYAFANHEVLVFNHDPKSYCIGWKGGTMKQRAGGVTFGAPEIQFCYLLIQERGFCQQVNTSNIKKHIGSCEIQTHDLVY